MPPCLTSSLGREACQQWDRFKTGNSTDARRRAADSICMTWKIWVNFRMSALMEQASEMLCFTIYSQIDQHTLQTTPSLLLAIPGLLLYFYS